MNNAFSSSYPTCLLYLPQYNTSQVSRSQKYWACMCKLLYTLLQFSCGYRRNDEFLQKLRKLTVDYDNFCKECWAYCSVSPNLPLMCNSTESDLFVSVNCHHPSRYNTMQTTIESWPHAGHFLLRFILLRVAWKMRQSAMSSWNG